MSKFFNGVGLLLNIIGAVLIYKFGLPPQIDPDGRSYRVTVEVDTAEKKKAGRFIGFANAAVVLLIIGFLFQFIALFL